MKQERKRLIPVIIFLFVILASGVFYLVSNYLHFFMPLEQICKGGSICSTNYCKVNIPSPMSTSSCVPKSCSDFLPNRCPTKSGECLIVLRENGDKVCSSSSYYTNKYKQKTTYNLRNIIQTDRVEFSVDRAELQHSNPPKGGSLLIVYWAYTNIQKNSIENWIQPSVKLIIDGKKYDEDGEQTNILRKQKKIELVDSLLPSVKIHSINAFTIKDTIFSKSKSKIEIMIDGKSYYFDASDIKDHL